LKVNVPFRPSSSVEHLVVRIETRIETPVAELPSEKPPSHVTVLSPLSKHVQTAL
jgi:hypothetical protein